MSLTPPPGRSAPLDLTVVWAASSGRRAPVSLGVAGPDQYLTPSGWTSSSFGTTLFTSELLTPSGWASSAFGTAVIYNTSQPIICTGWASSAFGTPVVFNSTRVLALGGIAPPPSTGPNADRQIPDPSVGYWTRYLDLDTPDRGIAPPAWTNTHNIAWEIQYIDQAGRGWDSARLGQPTVGFALRTVYPNFIASMVFGTHNIARNQFIDPSGIGSTNAFGTAQLDINLQRVFATGVAPANDYGEPVVRNEREYLLASGLASSGPGFPIVENSKRYLEVGIYENNEDPTGWPSYSPFVENKIRVLAPSGWMSSRFSFIGNFIENGARALLPTGWDSFVWSPGNFIGHYTRYITPGGLDSFVSQQYSSAHNDASLLAPTGWGSSAFGTPGDVRNLNRTVLHHSGPSDATYGTAFVSFSPRTIASGLFYDVYFPIPEVRLNPHPLVPAGIAPPANTAATVYEHFNILGPSSVNVHAVPWVGEPFVQNRNKTLLPYPSDQALYGNARIFNYNTHLTVSAGDTARYGSALVEHRTKTIYATTVTLPAFPASHQIRNLLPDPPSQQAVIVGAFSVDDAFGELTIFVLGAYPQGIPPVGFGGHAVRGNGIFPTSIVDEDLMGSPLVGGTQYAFPPSIPYVAPPEPGEPEPETYGDSDGFWTKNTNPGHEWPRLSPHTVYAPRGDHMPPKAVDNNPPYPEKDYHTIDGLMAPGHDDSRNPFFGKTWISLKNRTIGPVPLHGGQLDGLDPSSVVSDGAVVDLRVRYVFPDGIRSQRFGRVVFWGVPQYITLDPDSNGIIPGDYYDLDPPEGPPIPPSIHTVAYAELFNRPVYPTGFTGEFGTTTIELLNREVAPQGIPHRGNPQQNLTNPWGVPLVGYPRTYSWTAGDLALYGTAWVSHYTREVYPEGWNSSSLESTSIEDFDARMRVKAKTHAVAPAPFGAPTFGWGIVSFGLRTVLGRGFSGYTSGNPTVSSSVVIYPSGWDSAEYGDIDEWEADKIKPHGDDLGSVGIPKLLHPLFAESVDDGAMGVIRVCSVISVAGMPPVGFDGPSVTDPYGCSLRVVTTLPILSQQNVPTPVVAHV